MKLTGKVAIITGSSRGVGYYMAREFAKEGCNIVVAARTEEAADPRLPGTIYSTAEELRSMGVKALPVRTDVTDEGSIQAMVDETLREFGRIDVLINNAGIMVPGGFLDVPLKRWDLIWRVNVRGAVACSKAVLPTMIEQRDGVVIHISSIAADQPGAWNVSYRVTKRALRDLAEGMAGEFKDRNVRVFSLSPLGLVVTPGTMYHRLPEQMPSGPMVESEEAMGLAAIYLCSPDAAERTGQHFYSRELLRELGHNV